MSVFLLILALCCPAMAARIQVQVEESSLVLGQTVTLEVQIIDGRVTGVPEFPVGAGLRARYRGQGQTRSIINMKTTQLVRYSYQLTALTEGDWKVGPFDLDVGGQRLTHPPLLIEVTAASKGEQEQVSVRAELSDEAPYVGELVTYHLAFRRQVDAHNIRWTPPETPGFIVEPSAELAQRDRSQINNGVETAVLDIHLPLRATGVGKQTISPAVITADLPAPPDPRTGRRPVDVFGRYRLRSKSLPTTPLAVEVRPLPSAGRPPNFSGLVGAFTLELAASDTTVVREETVTVTVTLQGTGVLAGFVLPAVADTDQYRVYDDSPTVETIVTEAGVVSKAVFRRAIVPLAEGTMTIPGIEIPVFDPAQGAYVTVASPPVGLRVLPGVASGDESVQRFSTGQDDRRRDVEALGDDILPAPGDITVADRTFAGALPVMALLPMLPLFGFAVLGVRAVAARRRSDPWAELASRAVPSAADQRMAMISSLFRDAAALRIGCTPSEIDKNRLEPLGEAVVALYLDLESARYGGGAAEGLVTRVQAFVANRGTI
ncbi:MAG: hypothetical protein CL927_13850 [Deltaproteobacteria bacterium]|nr:hypothetical protein [Deltaproteobacteria bacterium]HCH61886.1 hypothetical protein [Deltaproteobacteria bacterium]